VKGEEQRNAATEQMSRLLASQRLLSSFDTEGHKWSSEKIDDTFDFDTISQDALASTSQFDISQTLSDIVQDATSRFTAFEQKQSAKEINETLRPTAPKRSARFEQRQEPGSPIAAFNTPTRKDHDEFLKVAESVFGNKAEPFPLDDGRKARVTPDAPGPRVAPLMPVDQLVDVQAGQDVATAVSEFTVEMTRFAESVVNSLNTLTRRLNSLSRVLESEGHDIR